MPVSKLCWGTLPLGMALLACSDSGGLVQAPEEPTPTPAAIAVVSGDDQEGKAGEQLGEPFVVRVTDAQGDGLKGVVVTWSVTSGDGAFSATPSGGRSARLESTTDADGLAQAFFVPTAVGKNAAAARVPSARRLQGSPAFFTVNAPGVQLAIWLAHFWGPCAGFCPADITVPVGTTVEWRNWDPTEHTVTSTSTPSGGMSFDSGTLNEGDRFQFVPDVAGTWEYFDQIGGATATLTAE